MDITLYDFALLLRSAGLTLTHFCIERVRIINSIASNDYLLQLQRVRVLNSLRIDVPLTEVRARSRRRPPR